MEQYRHFIKGMIASVLCCSLAVTAAGLQAFADTESAKVSVSELDEYLRGNLNVPMDSSVGSKKITGLQVPVLAYDDTSITLVWEKPEQYADIIDYEVYMNGAAIGRARENFRVQADWAAAYMDSFYEGYTERNIDMVQVDIHNFRVTGLEPDTEYDFFVRAVNEEGIIEESQSDVISWSTAKVPEYFNILDYGAVAFAQGPVAYNEEISQKIKVNTEAIQAAIDACTKGGVVVIPEGIFPSGSLYLKSNMTLKLEEGSVLWGSPNIDHYDQNYLLYPYSTDTRSWALVNAYSADEHGMLENIRITGTGIINGNGWKYGKKTEVTGDGYTPVYQTRDPLDPLEDKYRLEQWVAGKNNTTDTLGILAKDAYAKAAASGLAASSAYAARPNIVVLRGVDGVYVDGITVKNPPNHTIAVLDSKNVVSSNVKYITYDCNNGDGIELGNTQNAFVFNNFFDTGDDSINFATGMGRGVQETGQLPSKNIWTFNNFIRNGHGGAIAAGSHTGAGICNMLVEDNVMNLSEMPFRFKSAPANGGGIYDVLIRDCAVANSRQLFTFTTAYSDANQSVQVEPADKPAEFYNIKAYNITSDGKMDKNTFQISADVDLKNAGYKTWHTHHDMYYQDITITNAKKGEEIKAGERITFDNVTMTYSGTVVPWSNISYSSALKFINGTTTSVYSENASSPPIWEDGSSLTAELRYQTPSDGYTAVEAEMQWTAAQDNIGIDSYSIEIYDQQGNCIDKIENINTVQTIIPNLCQGVEYKFRVFASDAAGNRTGGPITQAAAGEIGVWTEELLRPEDLSVQDSGTGYTWSLCSWDNGYRKDKRIRGYRFYVNGELTETFYNYQLKDSRSAEKIRQNVRYLRASTNNQVQIEAFSDTGQVVRYEPVSIQTTEQYDWKAPEWPSGSQLIYSGINSEGGFILSWNEPEDESGIWGYRLYADGKPVLGENGISFNHVNGEYTTQNTTYTVYGLSLTEDHTFRVEASDAWWKAVEGSGPYHWTFSGPEYRYAYVPEVPVPSQGYSTGVSKKSSRGIESGWKQKNGVWYFQKNDGSMAVGWLNTGGKWYFMDEDGKMKTGWLLYGGQWYYLQLQGHMIEEDWYLDQGSWYYFGKMGVMYQNQWMDYGGNWYYMLQSGAMAVDTSINDFKIDRTGIWIP